MQECKKDAAMASDAVLKELEDALLHFFCAGIEEPTRKISMENAVRQYIREEVSRFSDEDILQMFYTQENAFKLVFEHLARQGKVRLRDRSQAPSAS